MKPRYYSHLNQVKLNVPRAEVADYKLSSSLDGTRRPTAQAPTTPFPKAGELASRFLRTSRRRPLFPFVHPLGKLLHLGGGIA